MKCCAWALRERDTEVWAAAVGRVPVQRVKDAIGTSDSSLATDIEDIRADQHLKLTQKDALIKARLGQGKFREDVLGLWGQACAVTGCTVLEVLRASHIKPWSVCSNRERLDQRNGLPLGAHLDALFDSGLVSFDDHGRLLIGSGVSGQQCNLLRLGNLKLREMPRGRPRDYLAYHRDTVFKTRNSASLTISR